MIGRGFCALAVAAVVIATAGSQKLSTPATEPPASVAGPVIAIGGGKDVPAIARKFYELAGGPEARLLVVPTATSQERPGEAMAAFLRELGATNVGIWLPKSRADADTPASLAALRAAKSLYFTGGDQKRTMTLLGGTLALDAIRDMHRTGVVVGGSSAGAAVLSRVMLEGGEGAGALTSHRIVTSEGLDVTGPWIVDQHFFARGRMPRLLNVLLDNPTMHAIGVDERTAAIFFPDRIEIIGLGQALVCDPPRGVSTRMTDTRPLFTAEDLHMRLLAPGDVLKL